MRRALGLAAFFAVMVSGFAGASPAGATVGGGGTWTSTGPLTLARGFHTADRQAIRLANGSLLVEGGDTTNGKISSAVTNGELFDPLTKTWTATAPLGIARDFFSATLLQDGRVLVAGGYGASNSSLASSEIYEPVTGTLSTAHPL